MLKYSISILFGAPQMNSQQSLSILTCFSATLVELAKSIPVHSLIFCGGGRGVVGWCDGAG